MAQPRLTEDDASHLLDYHLQRNRQARQSHRKSWLRKHKMAVVSKRFRDFSE